MFLLCTFDNSRNQDTGKERSSKDKQSQRLVVKTLSVTSNKDEEKKCFL